MNLSFLAPVIEFYEAHKPKAKTKAEKLAALDKKTYAGFNLQYHRRYDGTYMLFGFDRKSKRELLLNATRDYGVASKWAQSYGCDMPEITSYTPCTCCS